jgi:hypothetical protein
VAFDVPERLADRIHANLIRRRRSVPAFRAAHLIVFALPAKYPSASLAAPA